MKRFFIFLVGGQALIVVMHLILYATLAFFYPTFFQAHRILLLTLTLILSVLFLSTTILSVRSDNWLLRIVYTIAAVWMPIFIYGFAASIVALFFYLITRPLDIASYTPWATFFYALSLAACIYGLINARILRTVRISVQLPNLPENWKGKTVALVTDTHLGHILRHSFAQKIVDRINRAKPEMVLIPGDFYDGVHADYESLARVFSGLKSPLGTYFVTGNHEKFFEVERHTKAIAAAGIHVIDEQKLDLNGLQLIGTGYYGNETPESLRQSLERMNLDPTKPTIQMKHVPDHLDVPEQMGVNLIVCGHTHLGQMFPFRYITRKIFKGYDYGLKRKGGMHVYTSSGAGTWGPPVRVLTNSEMILITLT